MTKLPCRFAHRTVIGRANQTPVGCVALRASSHATAAKQRTPKSCGRSLNAGMMTMPLANVSHAARLVAAPAARQARKTRPSAPALMSARSTARANQPP
jgi:hypothetical protein